MNEGIRDLMFFFGLPFMEKKPSSHRHYQIHYTIHILYKKNLSPAKACSKYKSVFETGFFSAILDARLDLHCIRDIYPTWNSTRHLFS